MTTNEPNIPAIDYNRKRADIELLGDWLDDELNRHASEAPEDGVTWGHVGDLDYVRSKLKEAYAHMSGMPLDGIDQALADVEFPDRILAGDGCPRCGETRTDNLVWHDEETVECTTCGRHYSPDPTPPSEEPKPAPTEGDYADEAESAQRAGAWPQAAALWRRAAEACEDAERKAKYLASAKWCDDMPGISKPE